VTKDDDDDDDDNAHGTVASMCGLILTVSNINTLFRPVTSVKWAPRYANAICHNSEHKRVIN
jgi:hypothetical protein